MSLEVTVKKAIVQYGMIAPGDGVVVAVSGGPDSMALLHVLYDLRDELMLRLEVAHVQHGIRGEAARQDAQFVAAVAERLGLPFHLKEINLIETRSNLGKGNLEAMAREVRYRFLIEVARQHKLQKVATAHTQDDQAETVLMWLLRGCGRKGLGGMSPLRSLSATEIQPLQEIALIRPLLEVSREEILQYLRAKSVEYRLDRTNLDLSYLRNWIRLELIPQLKERIDPQLGNRLARQASLLRAEEEYLRSHTEAVLKTVANGDSLIRESFLSNDTAMQRRLLRLWIEKVRGHLRGIDFEHVEEAIRLIAVGPPQGRLSIPGGWEFVKQYEKILLEKRRGQGRPVCYNYTLRCGGELDVIEAGMKIESSLVASPLMPVNEMEAVFDIASLPDALTVRNFRHGDRFQPLGMSGHKKVKELFIEQKVPLSVRSTLPLLSLGQEILWIPGYGRSDFAKVHSNTKEILHFKAVYIER